jgi:uncharacterized protein (DUF885 family)
MTIASSVPTHRVLSLLYIPAKSQSHHDVRMHTAGWSREDATAYLARNAGISVEAAKGQAYRYSRIPLQAVSYYLGARQFEELYSTYHVRYGDEFYRQVLSLGPVPPRLIGEYLASP